MRSPALLFLATVLIASPAIAAELIVGPDEEFWTPSEAANYAENGDTIIIREGRYEDCAVWRADDLTIIGEGAGAVVHGDVCQGKALWVTQGDNLTLESVTFEGAAVRSGNGAGIRAEGSGLTLRRVTFTGNQMGILGSRRAGGEVIIENSSFVGNGGCARICAHALYIGRIDALRVTGSRFEGTLKGHNIKSGARLTEVIDNVIIDGESGSSSYAVDLNRGGNAIIRGNEIVKGPDSDNQKAAIAITGGEHPTEQILVEANRYSDEASGNSVLVLNLEKTGIGRDQLILRNNEISNAKPLSGAGKVEGSSFLASVGAWLDGFIASFSGGDE